MKYAIDAFDQLQDSTSYLGSSYLRISLSDNILDLLSYVNGAFCFLLDRSVFKENAGEDITASVKDSILLTYKNEFLTEKAVSIYETSKDPNFLKDTNSFSTYWNSLADSEEYLTCAYEDEIGLLTLCYLKEVSSLIEIDAKSKGYDPLKVNEIVLLNMTYSVAQILKGFYGTAFKSLKSFDFFDEICLHAQRVRSEILD